MSKATGLWNAAKEAYRTARGLLSKNERNTAAAQAKKERGPVKAFFHITKNENVPAIERQGLLTNHPNANINSANHPFRKHGTDAGGVWVTTEPTAFPVYGTTIGGKSGDAAARANALSTIKIEVPLPELAKMDAVQDPYGENILRWGHDPRAIQKFPTWAGIDVPATVFLDDIKPQWLKNIGYVEELNPKTSQTYFLPELVYDDISNSSKMSDLIKHMRANKARQRYESKGLNKADRNAMSYVTGHDKRGARAGNVDAAKSPARFVEEYLDKHRPIKDRSSKLPNDGYAYNTVNDPLQYPYRVTEENHGYLRELPLTAADWTEMYRPYTKFGEAPRKVIFQPGAYSRGIGTIPIENIRINISDEIKGRNFNWNTYKQLIAEGKAPSIAADYSMPRYYLDWDNIVYNPKLGYAPNKIWPEDGNHFRPNIGHISAGTPRGRVTDAVTGELLVNPNTQGAVHQYHQLTPEAIESLKIYNAYDDIVKDKDHPTWQELTRVLMRINAGTSTPYW